MRKRSSRRFTKRLEVTFSSGGSKCTGISSDLSADGLFIRTQNGLAPGNVIDIEIYLPEDKVGRLKGVVRRTVKTSLSLIKNGMGIEIIEKDSNYLDFLKNFYTDNNSGSMAAPHHHERQSNDEPETEKASYSNPEFIIIACENCKVKNKVRTDRLLFGPRCGKCGTALRTGDIG